MELSKAKTKIPAWIIEPMRMLHQRIVELEGVIQMFNMGQTAIEALPTILKNVKDLGFPKELVDEAARNLVEKAKTLESPKNNFLYRQAAIALYSYLEATIKDLVIAHFKNTNLTDIKEIANLKISIVDYDSLGKEARFDFIFEHYERILTAGIQYGPTRFEKLLSPIKLSGAINADVNRKLYEFAQVRNNCLHKGGKIDNYLLTSCPWLSLKLGESLILDKIKYEEYEQCVTLYLETIETRILSAFNENPSNFSVFSPF
jgi:hypothetical protein